jgi:hypothetical protein
MDFEQGPVTNVLMAQFGILGVAAIKIGLPMLMWRYPKVIVEAKPGIHHRAGRATFRSLLVLTMYSGYVGAAFNAYAIGTLLALS